MKTCKFRLVPGRGEAEKMAQHAGASRAVWNCGIAYMESRREIGLKSVRFMTKGDGLAAFFTQLREDGEYSWLKDLSSVSVRHSLKRLDSAYQAAFRRRKQGLPPNEWGFPKFHGRRDDESFTLPDVGSFSLGERGIRMAKIGWVRMRPNRGRGDCAVDGTPKMVIVKREAGRWFACVQCAIDAPAPKPHNGDAVGIDMGVAKPYTLSTGGIFNAQEAAKLEARKKRYQRIMARRSGAALRGAGWDGKSETRKAAESRFGKKRAEERRELLANGETKMPPKYSGRYEVAKRRAAKASRGLKNVRQNWLHQMTSEIVRKHGMIFVENLQIKNMTASAKGTAKAPGKNVAQKRGMNRAILKQGWGIARGMLAYKSEWAGGRMETVAAQNTSRRCAGCGHTAKENRRTQAAFKCVNCGHSANADVNAAINILHKGLKNFDADGETAFGRGDGGGGSGGLSSVDSSRSVKRQTSIEQRGKTSGKKAAETPRMSREQSDTPQGANLLLFCG